MRDRLRTLVSPLESAACRRLFGAQLVSGLGDWAGRLALAVVVFERSGSAWWTAAVTIVSLLPWLGPGQYLATFADRFGRIQIMATTDLARAALFLVMLIPMPVAPLLGLAFAAGVCVPPFVGARSAAVVELVPGDQYGRALALFGVTTQIELVVGYALGGVLIATLDARTALAVNALTFVVSALLLAGLRGSTAAGAIAGASIGWHGVRAGLQPWRDDPLCRRALVLFAGVSAVMILPEALIVPYADQIGAADAVIGLLAASIAAGAAIAMTLSPRADDDRNLLRAASRRAVLPAAAAAVLFIGSSAVPWLGVLALFCSGAVDAIAVPTNQVVGHRLARDRRAAAIAVAAGAQYGMQTATIAVGGALAVVLGPRAVLTAAGFVAMGLAGWSWWRPPATPAPWPPPRSIERVA